VFWIKRQDEPTVYVKCVPYHLGKARPQVADGGDGLQIWRAAANILNKQLRTGDKGGPPAWRLDVGLTTPHCKKIIYYKISQRAQDLDRFFG
jgi:hypothetical protein